MCTAAGGHIEVIPLPEDEFVPAGAVQQQHRSSVRRRQLLPEAQVGSAAASTDAAPGGRWGSWTLGPARRLLAGWLQRLRQALGGGQSLQRGAAARGQNRWTEGDRVVPWYWRTPAAS
jgi:hypothetical protein